MGYSPRGHKESDMTERLDFHFNRVIVSEIFVNTLYFTQLCYQVLTSLCLKIDSLLSPYISTGILLSITSGNEATLMKHDLTNDHVSSLNSVLYKVFIRMILVMTPLTRT